MAQSWNMQNHDTVRIDGCQYSNGTIYDNGGATGYYSDSFDGWVIIESNVGASIHIIGNYNTESGADFINIWDNTTLVSEQVSGSGSINVTCSTGRAVIRFTTNPTSNRSGFNLSYNITGGPNSSNRINNLTASNITTTGATLQWSSGSSGPFHIVCDNLLDNAITTSSTTYTLTNLSANSRHTAKVYAAGMEGNRCAQGIVQFRTLCGTGQLPLTEDFNDVTTDQMPPCWTRSVNFDDALAMPRVVEYANGEKAQMLSCGSNNTAGHFGMVIAPKTASNASAWQVQFRMMVSHPYTRVIVGFCDSTSDEQTSYGFTPVETITPTSNGWIAYSRSYAVPTGGCRLAFRMEQSMQNGTGRMAYIDDINISTCGIRQARAIHADTTSLELVWDTMGTPDVSVTLSPVWGTGATLTLEHITSPLTVSGLTPGTEYLITFYPSCDGRIQTPASIEASTLASEDFRDDLCLLLKDWNSTTGTFDLAEGWTTLCPSNNAPSNNDDVFHLANNCYLISPPLNTMGGKELMLEYLSANPSTDRVVLGTMTYADDLSTFTPIDTIEAINSPYYSDTAVRLPAGITDNHLVLKGLCYGNGYINLRSLSLNAGHVKEVEVVRVRSTQVTLQWSAPSTGKVYIEYYTSPTGTHYLDSVTNTTQATITGLTPERTYFFHLYLPGTEPCPYVGELSVVTARRDYDLPYCEDFEEFQCNELNGWTVRNSLYECPAKSVEYVHSGSYSLKLAATTGDYYSTIALPQIDSVAGSIMSFWAYTLAPASSVMVGYYPLDGGGFVAIDTIAIAPYIGWRHYVCVLPPNIDGCLALRYKLTGCAGLYYVWIDDMTVSSANYSDYTFANLQCTSVDVVWHGIGTTDSLTVRLTSGNSTITATGVPDTIHVSGLSSSRAYECYILPHGSCWVYAGSFYTMNCGGGGGGGGGGQPEGEGDVDTIIGGVVIHPQRCNTMDDLLSYELPQGWLFSDSLLASLSDDGNGGYHLQMLSPSAPGSWSTAMLPPFIYNTLYFIARGLGEGTRLAVGGDTVTLDTVWRSYAFPSSRPTTISISGGTGCLLDNVGQSFCPHVSFNVEGNEVTCSVAGGVNHEYILYLTDPQGNTTGQHITSTPFTLTNLQPLTEYSARWEFLYLDMSCVPSFPLQTEAIPLPYCANFEDNNNTLPAGWTVTERDGHNDISPGGTSQMLFSAGSSQWNYIILPLMESSTYLQLSLYGSFTGQDLQIGHLASGTDTSTFVLDTVAPAYAMNPLTVYSFGLRNIGSQRIALRYHGSSLAIQRLGLSLDPKLHFHIFSPGTLTINAETNSSYLLGTNSSDEWPASLIRTVSTNPTTAAFGDNDLFVKQFGGLSDCNFAYRIPRPATMTIPFCDNVDYDGLGDFYSLFPTSSYYVSFTNTDGRFCYQMTTHTHGPTLFVFPYLSNSSISNIKLSFDGKAAIPGSSIEVGVLSDLLDTTSFVPIDTVTFATSDWQRKYLDLSSYSGSARWLAFRATSSLQQGPFYFNRIRLETCFLPPSVTVRVENYTEVVVEAEAGTTVNGPLWIEYCADGVLPGTGPLLHFDSLPARLSLNPSTTYTIMLYCSNNRQGCYGQNVVSTQALPIYAPSCTNFDSENLGVVPQGWHSVSGSSEVVRTTSHSPLRSLAVRGTVATPTVHATLLSDVAAGFWVKATETGVYLIVGCMTDASNASTFHPLKLIVPKQVGVWEYHMVSFDDAPANARHIAFRNASGNAANLFVDDLLLTRCTIHDLSIQNFGNASIEVAWHQLGNPDATIKVLDLTISSSQVYDLSSVATHSLSIPITPQHNYQITIHSSCPDEEMSCAVPYNDTLNIEVPAGGFGCIDPTDLTLAQTGYYSGTYANPYANRGAINFGPQQAASRHTIHTDTTERDPRTGGLLRTIPPGHDASVRLGNWSTNTYLPEAEGIIYSILVDTLDFSLLLLRYAAVLQDPMHAPDDQPRFRLEVLDTNFNLIDPLCSAADFIANRNLGWNQADNNVLWKDWTTVGVDLSAHHGQQIYLRLTTYDCNEGSHYGYAYFTLECMRKSLTTENCGEGDTNIFTAPAGFNYRWYTTTSNATLSTAQTLVIPATLNTTYLCDLSFVGDTNCRFTLSAFGGSRFPMARFDTVVSYSDCRINVQFVNRSTVTSDGINPVPTGESAESAHWDFGNGLVSDSYHGFSSYDQPGTYLVTLIAAIGDGACTDTIVVPLTVDFPSHAFVTGPDTLCFGDLDTLRLYGATTEDTLWQWAGGLQVMPLSPQTYHVGDNLLSAISSDPYGCTLGPTHLLHVIPTLTRLDSLRICTPELPFSYADTLFLPGTTLADYHQYGTSVHGCDSSFHLHLQVVPTTEHTVFDTTKASICDNQRYSFFGTPYNTPGEHFANAVDSLGLCDSLHSLLLDVRPTSAVDTVANACDRFTWHQTLYLADTVVSRLDTNIHLCDSTTTLYLYVHPSYELNDSIVVCHNQRYVYEGIDYEGPIAFPAPHFSIHHCDSLVHVTLYASNPLFPAPPVVSLDSLEWYPYDTLLLGCQPQPLHLADTSISVSRTWTLWNPDSPADTLTSGLRNYVPILDTTGIFGFQLITVSDEGCRDTVRNDSLLWVFPSPHASFIWSPDHLSMHNPEVRLYNQSSPEGTSFLWLVSKDLNGSTFDTLLDESPYYAWERAIEPGEYPVSLVAYWLHHGPDTLTVVCTDTATVPIAIVNTYLQFPNSVTPNGDGINDLWIVVNLLEMGEYSMNELWIYDRFGALVYHVEDIHQLSDFWDPNQTNSPDGTYYYRFSAKNNFGLVKRNGVIEVSR
ncbi:MAG: gliding motility-associated C-terminal domain-containing protein [Bacteroidales bacterium]|nr:gliding motility-associated C-terminal domain-containing protein [Bacteroidales bacterium]